MLETLKRTPLFAGLGDAEMEALGEIVRVVEVGRNRLIFSEGEPAEGFHVVGSGKVKVFKASADGKEKILHIFGSGEPVGEVAMFAGFPYPATAIALEQSRMLFIPRAEFEAAIRKMPGLAMGMLGVLSLRLREFASQIEQLALMEVPGRLAAYLETLRGEQGEEAIELPISKAQLASLLGTIPETLSRILAKMSGAGLITVEGRRIRIRDADGIALLKSGERRV